jgi:hypothetical protein
MNKKSQSNVFGIGTTPDHGMNMNFFFQMDIIFIEVKDRPWQLPTTNESELVKAIEYEDLSGIDLFIKFYEKQESQIQEQEQRIKCFEAQLQDYEQEIYEKDQILQLAAELKPPIKQESNGKWLKPRGHKLGSTGEKSLANPDYSFTEQSLRGHLLDHENGGD